MKIFFIALFLGVTSLSWSQHSLSGTVTDSLQRPLKGVTAYLPDLHKTSITDASGNYRFHNLPSGTHRAVFSSLGYATQNLRIAVSGPTTQDLVLVASEFTMDEVVVSTAFSRLQSQNVMKVDKRSVADMQAKGAMTLAEGLTTVPGVAQVSTGSAIGKPVIRGLSANRVLVYTQGVRMENQQFGDEHGLGLSDSGVESAEVIKGPASLLYGSDAMGGVLYLNPEKFAEAGVTKADLSQRFFSNTLGSSTSLGVKTSSENWKVLARGNYATHSDYETPGQGRVVNTRFNEKDLKLATGYSNASFASVLRYNFNRLDIGIPEEGTGGSSESKETLYPKQDVQSHIVSLGNTFFFRQSKLDANFGYVANLRKEFEDSPVAALDMRLGTLTYDLKYHFPKVGNWEFISGVQGLWQQNDNHGEERLIPDATVADFGGFATTSAEWDVNTFQAGLRYDVRHIEGKAFAAEGEEGSFAALDRSFSSLNAQAGYRRKLDQHNSLRFNLATGFRAPNLAELRSNGVHEGTNRYERGNGALTREQNLQADLNYDYTDSHFEFFVNGFYNAIADYIYAAPTGEMIDDHAVFAYVQSDARLYGGEAGFHLHPHPLDWLHFESDVSHVTGRRSDGRALPLIPATVWNNTLRGEFSAGKWLADGFASLRVQCTFDQNDVDVFETRTGGYTLFNLAFGGKLMLSADRSALVRINANNLFDRTYTAHLSRLKTDGIPNMGRNITLSVAFGL